MSRRGPFAKAREHAPIAGDIYAAVDGGVQWEVLAVMPATVLLGQVGGARDGARWLTALETMGRRGATGLRLVVPAEVIAHA